MCQLLIASIITCLCMKTYFFLYHIWDLNENFLKCVLAFSLSRLQRDRIQMCIKPTPSGLNSWSLFGNPSFYWDIFISLSRFFLSKITLSIILYYLVLSFFQCKVKLFLPSLAESIYTKLSWLHFPTRSQNQILSSNLGGK